MVSILSSMDAVYAKMLVYQPVSYRAIEVREESVTEEDLSLTEEEEPEVSNEMALVKIEVQDEFASVYGTIFECDECGKKFPRLNHLRCHQWSHSKNEKPFICEECGKRFTKAYSLKLHLHLHSEECIYNCDSCGLKFIDSSQIHSRNNQQPFACHDCGIPFTNTFKPFPKKLGEGEKPFGCQYCGKKFSTARYLEVHLRIHTGEKPFECTDCGKRFTQEIHLTTHKRTHSDEKPYICVDCGKGFSQPNNLRTHRRIHLEEKPFACPSAECGKKFSDQSNFKRHLRTSGHVKSEGV